MSNQWDIAVVGNGIAGFSAARAARQQSAACSILLIGEEDQLPYKRTQLSKSIAAGFDRDAFQLQPARWYEDQGIALMVAQRAVSVTPQSHTLLLSTGETVQWKQLILATGSIPVRPAFDPPVLPRVFVVRTARGVQKLIEAAKEVESVCVVGASVLGVEVAAQMVAAGKSTTLVCCSPALMERHLNSAAAGMLAKEFAERNVRLLYDRRVESLTAAGGEHLRVWLSDGHLATELAVFCTGVQPDIELAKTAGLAVHRGILVDRRLRTSHADIFAAGDVAEHPDGQITGLWHAAEHQGSIAGANAAGGSMLDPRLPFRLKCEVFGRYFFSANKPPESDLPGFEIKESFADPLYRCLYFKASVLRGAVMVDDKEHAGKLETAVREGWVKERALAEFAL